MTKAHELFKHGQSIWYDNIRRSFIESGDLASMIEQGIRGVTSNPAIFEKAIGQSDDYDVQLQELVSQEKTIDEIYDALVIQDIQAAADVLRPLYDESNGGDGYISLEVSPTLARDTEGTIADARRYFAAVGRPNVMIKIPATPEGIPAIKQAISEGININVTLMFSLADYDAVAGAYIEGLQALVANGGDPGKVASVASFFVSRVDGKVDAALEAVGNTELQGKIGIANARLAYERFEETFSGDTWDALAEKGATVQRPLWASTGVKNPIYPDTLYVDALIGAHTVNTVPPATLDALMKEATTDSATVGNALEDAHAQVAKLKDLGIDLDKITADLQDEGVDKFAVAFESLMNSIKDKRERLLEGSENAS